MRTKLLRRSRPPAAPGVGGGSAATACAAPRSALYFAPDGQVRACCVNTEYTLGRIGEQTIREIWDGARVEALRHALDAGDYSLGCQDCEHRLAAGDREWSTAAQYDRYATDVPGPFPRRMDFILSITCNLQCVMCNGDLSSSIRLHREHRPPMAPAYDDAFFDELSLFLPHLERSVFLGGEPFVARESQRVFDLMIELGCTGEVQVVTNGTQWNARVERYLRELPMSLTVSIDGATAETLEALRVGVDHERLWTNVDRYQEVLADTGGTLSFHYCLMRQNWQEFGAFLLEADRRGAHALVMTVTGPDGFSLWDLPAEELGVVLAALEDEDRSLAPRLTLNRAAWDGELDRVRRHLRALASGHRPEWVAPAPDAPGSVPVKLSTRATGGAEARAEAVRVEADAADWAGRPPIVARATGGTIRSVEVPAWARPLDVGSWVGSDLEGVSGRLESHLGPASTPRVTEHGGGLVEAHITFGGRDGSPPVRSRSVVSPAGSSDELRVVVALAEPTPATVE